MESYLISQHLPLTSSQGIKCGKPTKDSIIGGWRVLNTSKSSIIEVKEVWFFTAMIGFMATGRITVKPNNGNHEPSNDKNHNQPVIVIYPPAAADARRSASGITGFCLHGNGNPCRELTRRHLHHWESQSPAPVSEKNPKSVCFFEKRTRLITILEPLVGQLHFYPHIFACFLSCLGVSRSTQSVLFFERGTGVTFAPTSESHSPLPKLGPHPLLPQWESLGITTLSSPPWTSTLIWYQINKPPLSKYIHWYQNNQTPFNNYICLVPLQQVHSFGIKPTSPP